MNRAGIVTRLPVHRGALYDSTMAETVDDLAPAVAGFTPAQVAAAYQLIEDRAILPATRPGVWVCVSTDGSKRYFAHAGGCDCPARGRCYHMAGARLMNLARVRKAA